ncbi:hypothetical protein ACFVH6_07670 [Spirillospora sp. NPDC127200]
MARNAALVEVAVPEVGTAETWDGGCESDARKLLFQQLRETAGKDSLRPEEFESEAFRLEVCSTRWTSAFVME